MNDAQLPYSVETPAQTGECNSNVDTGTYQPVGDRQSVHMFTTSNTKMRYSNNT